MSIKEIRNEIAVTTEKCDQNLGVIYEINKRGSDYSVHKTMLPVGCTETISPIKKVNSEVIKGKRACGWRFNFNKDICQSF